MSRSRSAINVIEECNAGEWTGAGLCRVTSFPKGVPFKTVPPLFRACIGLLKVFFRPQRKFNHTFQQLIGWKADPIAR
jgi:hypothetical protein